MLPDATVPARYAGVSGDFNPIHLDSAYAREVAGLPGPVLHGLYGMCLLAQASIEAAGGDASALTSLSAEFTDMAFPERELVVRGTISQVKKQQALISCSVQQSGHEVISAEAELRTASRVTRRRSDRPASEPRRGKRGG